MCSDGRTCKTNFRMGYAYGGLLSYQYIFVNPIVISYLLQCGIVSLGSIVIILTVIIGPLIYYWMEKRNEKTKAEFFEGPFTINTPT